MSTDLVPAGEAGLSTAASAQVEQAFSAAQLAILTQQTPDHEIKERPGKGGGTWKYVTGEYVIRTLNDAFGRMWSWEITGKEFYGSPGKIPAEVEVTGRLTVNTPSGIAIVKEAVGGTTITLSGEEPLSISNDVKSATTSALKKAAAMLGIALDLYAKKDQKNSPGEKRGSSGGRRPEPSASSNAGPRPVGGSRPGNSAPPPPAAPPPEEEHPPAKRTVTPQARLGMMMKDCGLTDRRQALDAVMLITGLEDVQSRNDLLPVHISLLMNVFARIKAEVPETHRALFLQQCHQHGVAITSVEEVESALQAVTHWPEPVQEPQPAKPKAKAKTKRKAASDKEMSAGEQSAVLYGKSEPQSLADLK